MTNILGIGARIGACLDKFFQDVTRELMKSVLLIEADVDEVTDDVRSQDKRKGRDGNQFGQVDDQIVGDAFALMRPSHGKEFGSDELHVSGKERQLCTGELSGSRESQEKEMRGRRKREAVTEGGR
jgi:hypothetical protein